MVFRTNERQPPRPAPRDNGPTVHTFYQYARSRIAYTYANTRAVARAERPSRPIGPTSHLHLTQPLPLLNRPSYPLNCIRGPSPILSISAWHSMLLNEHAGPPPACVAVARGDPLRAGGTGLHAMARYALLAPEPPQLESNHSEAPSSDEMNEPQWPPFSRMRAARHCAPVTRHLPPHQKTMRELSGETRSHTFRPWMMSVEAWYVPWHAAYVRPLS